MPKKWKIDGVAYGYTVWKNEDEDGRAYYNVTKGDKPPKTNSGYYSRSHLIAVKRSRLLGRGGK